jgi:hypothetical protein
MRRDSVRPVSRSGVANLRSQSLRFGRIRRRPFVRETTLIQRAVVTTQTGGEHAQLRLAIGPYIVVLWGNCQIARRVGI